MRTYKEYFFDELEERARLLRNRSHLNISFIDVSTIPLVGLIIVRQDNKTLRVIEYLFNSMETATIKTNETSDCITYKYGDDKGEEKALKLCLPEFRC